MKEIGGKEGAAGRVAYSLQETARASGRKSSAVYQQVQAGQVPTVRLGRRHLVPASYFAAHGLSLDSADEKDNA